MDEKRKTVKFNGKKLYLQVSKYMNGNLAILSNTEEEPYGHITINLSGFSVDGNEGFINSITKSSGLEKQLIKEGIIKEVITNVKYNMGNYDMVVFDIEKLKEYDPIGVRKYQRTVENIEEFE